MDEGGRGMDDLDRNHVLIAALDAGFAISTAYGQDDGKLMPITDMATLMDFAIKLRANYVNQAESHC